MDSVRTNCPGCGKHLEFPKGIASLICTNCGASYDVHQYEGAMSLSVVPRTDESQAIDEELTEVDNLIVDLNAEIEMLKSKEQSAPLQKGCAVFGIFFLAVLVMSFFMTVGMDYFGKWPFYVSMVVIIALGLLRMRRRFATHEEIEGLRGVRGRLEENLRALNVERARLAGLKQALTTDIEKPTRDNED